MTAILNGIRILDLTSIVSGPFATMLLADLGADVISVEAPGGDAYRAAPPARSPRMGAPFMTINRGKRSVGVDLSTKGGQTVLVALARSADVAVHNLRPAAARRLGLDADTLGVHNPQLIHCTTTGFGSDGPDADLPAYDDIIQARSGLADLLAHDGAPQLAPTILVDKITGLHVANAILAALLHRERTGESLRVEVPMLEVIAAFITAEHMGGRAFDPPIGPPGYNRLLSPDHRPHATRDSHIVVMPYTTRHWVAFLDLARGSNPDIPDPRAPDGRWVSDPVARASRIGELHAVLARTLATKTTAEWLTACRAHDIPAGAVATLEDLLADPHLTAVGMFPTTDHPTEGRVVAPRHPVRYDGRAPDPAAPAPRPGADTLDMLRELGLPPTSIEGLLAAEAIWYDR